MSGLVLLSLIIIVYFFPSIVAINRGHFNSTPIVLTNIFFGWTLVIWLITLIWAFSSNSEHSLQKRERRQNRPQQKLNW